MNILPFALLVLLSAPLFANTQFSIRRMTRNDVPLGRGQCDIRLQIDGEAEVSVRGETVLIRTISGRDGRDDGSECNEPFPARDVRNFNYEVRDSRGEIVLLSHPSGRDGATFRIRDSKGGEGRYHVRLSWDITAGGGGRRDGYDDNQRGGRPQGGFDGGPRGGRGSSFTVAKAIDICQSAVKSKIAIDYRYSTVDIRVARADDRPGRNDFILGEAIGRRGGRGENFSFVCRVDFSSGQVRSVDVNRR